MIGFFIWLYLWPDVVFPCLWVYPKTLHTLFTFLGKKSGQEVCTSAESAPTFCSSLFSQSMMELSSGTHAGTKQQRLLAPQLHPFDCLCSFTCAPTVCVYNAGTRPERPSAHRGSSLGGMLCVCLDEKCVDISARLHQLCISLNLA